jgi:hypothetical protein
MSVACVFADPRHLDADPDPQHYSSKCSLYNNTAEKFKNVIKYISVVDRHRNDGEPDPNFRVDADLDPDPDCHQNNADPHSKSTTSFTHVGKS